MAYVKIRPRRGTASQWEYANPILSEGEMAFEVPSTGVGTGLINIKQGDGQNSWNNLPYAFNAATLSQRVDDLSNTVASYDATIATLTAKVNSMDVAVKNIRKIEIQSSDPVQEDLILGEIWINTDMVTGSMYITDENGTQITDINIPVGTTYNIKLFSTISAATIIEWKSTDDNICSITNKSATGCTLNANMATDGITITALAKSDATTVLMNAKLRVSITVNAGIEIVPSDLKLIVGQGSTLGLNKTSSGTVFDTIQWTSSANYYVGITSYTDTGAEIVALKAGSAMIYAKALINGFPVATSNCMVTVGGMSFAGDKTVVTAVIGDIINLNLIFTNMIVGEDYDAITWSSDMVSVAYISRSDNSSAVVIAQSAGSTYVRVRATKMGELVQELTCLFNINGRISIEPDSFELQVNGAGQGLELINDLGDGNWDTIEWDTSDPTVLQLDGYTSSRCNVRPIGAGSAVITATAYKDGIIVGTTASFGTVTGEIYISHDDVPTPDLTIAPGENATLKAVVDGIPSIIAYAWQTTDPSIVSIDSGSTSISCVIRGASEGQATITLQGLSSVGGAVVASYECVVTVQPN